MVPSDHRTMRDVPVVGGDFHTLLDVKQYWLHSLLYYKPTNPLRKYK